MWPLRTMSGCPQSGLFATGGSRDVTSSTAPPSRPQRTASARAASSMSAPRAAFTTHAESNNSERTSSETIDTVSSVTGAQSTRIEAPLHASRNRSTDSSESTSGRRGSCATGFDLMTPVTVAPKALAKWATRVPILPIPRITTRWPCRVQIDPVGRCQRPRSERRTVSWSRRIARRIAPNAHSATCTVLRPRPLETRMPRSRQTVRGRRSTPTVSRCTQRTAFPRDTASTSSTVRSPFRRHKTSASYDPSHGTNRT